MLQEFQAAHFDDAEGNPAGGHTWGTGFCIAWQNGPLGRGDKRKEPNGAFVETIIKAAVNRLLYYQGSKFACDHNMMAIEHLETALLLLNTRTKEREERQVEGTHKT